LGLSVVAIFMVAESVSLNDIVRQQGPLPWNWFFLKQPLAMILFVTAVFAETNRIPFDLPEGESELVAGYHVEYSSMKFALFFMAEYAAMVVAAAVVVSLFFGGWQVPFLTTEALRKGAAIYAHLLGLAISAFSVLAGLLLVSQYRRGKYRDLRDYEVLFFGIPAILFGLGLGAFLIFIGIPILPDWFPALFAAACQVACFLFKIALFSFFFVWVRWTIPRFRYDQLMSFGWKGMLPLALLNIGLTGVWLLIFP